MPHTTQRNSTEHRLSTRVPSRELLEWLALRRVSEAEVVKSAGIYFDHGRPVPHHMTGVFDQLCWTGLATVAAGDPIWSVRPLSLTDAGQARYVALCEQRQRATLPETRACHG